MKRPTAGCPFLMSTCPSEQTIGLSLAANASMSAIGTSIVPDVRSKSAPTRKRHVANGECERERVSAVRSEGTSSRSMRYDASGSRWIEHCAEVCSLAGSALSVASAGEKGSSKPFSPNASPSLSFLTPC